MHRYEAPVRLSRSMVWELQSRAYARGMAAWETGAVPSHMSSNAFLGRRYASLIKAFARDCQTQDEPFTIVELGAGSGRLSFNIIRSLLSQIGSTGEGRAPFRYVMTDFAENTRKAWVASGAFDQFIRNGIVDFAHFDADQPDTLVLETTGDRIGPDRPLPSLAVVGNYLIDTLRQDLFQVENMDLSEVRVAAASDEAQDTNDVQFLARLKLDRELVSINSPYYNDPELDDILERYRRRLERSSFLFPVGFMSAFRFLEQLSTGPMLSLLGDYGYRNLGDMEGLRMPSLAMHGDCFSLPANFDAVATYAAARGGAASFSSDIDTRFVTAAILMRAQPAHLPEFELTFRLTMAEGTPRDIYELLKNIGSAADELPSKMVPFVLKLANYDPQFMHQIRPAIEKVSASASNAVKQPIIEAMDQVAANYYPLGTSRDDLFQLGQLYQHLGALERAISMYERSMVERGDHYMRRYRLAQCRKRLGEYSLAREEIMHSLDLNPKFDQADRLRHQLERV